MFNKIRPLVFWPSFLILMAAVVMSFVDLDSFLRITKSLNATILDRFSWFFSLGSFYLLVLIVVVYFSPLEQGGFLSPFAQRLLLVFCSGPRPNPFIT